MSVVTVLVWLIAMGASGYGLYQAYRFYLTMMESDPGTAKMQEIAGFVRTGADAYLKQQYKVVGMFFIAIFLILLYVAFGLKAQSGLVPFAFVTGGFFSGLAGWIGMKTATSASNRTAAGAQHSLNRGLQVAFRSGAVMGLTVVGLGLLDICLWFAFLYWLMPLFGVPLTLEQITVTMLCFGMGASSQALFARVGGGIFTKAADVGADLVGKVEKGIPEDDPRNPATIADNVGDNVGDVAGMGADLYESYCGSILATAALGVAAFNPTVLTGAGAITSQTAAADIPQIVLNYQMAGILLPLSIAAAGIFLSILGIFLVKTEDDARQKTLLKALDKGISISTVAVCGVSIVLTLLLLYWSFWGVSISIVLGLVAGYLIGKWTEYSTSDEYKPTQNLADQAITGPATVIIGGIAEGMISTWVPVVLISIATLASFAFSCDFRFSDPAYFALGLYGVGISAVGMLSTLGITLATDAYGPIADNAGGNAEMSHLDPEVRRRTDALDSLGNTTAATGKGFAIGSAALTALALLAAYVEEVRVGLERWGESTAVALYDTNHDGKFDSSGLIKVGPSMIVQVEKDKSIAEGHTDWLVFPRDAQKSAAWVVEPSHAIDPTKFVVDAKAETLTAVGNTPENTRTFAIVNRKHATMPDFMQYYDATLMNPKVLIGVFIGSMSVFLFCAMTMKAVGRAAKGMVEEVRRQFREKPGIMEGTELPDYATPVEISTQAAQREMILPSLLSLILPVATGILLGVAGVLGLLVGTLTTGFCVAVFMANAGGAWDNAKKFIEAGAHGGKGTDAHKAAVVGDTVGDPFKDTSGPSLNILIKLMSMVSVVAAGLVVRYSLQALGIF